MADAPLVDPVPGRAVLSELLDGAEFDELGSISNAVNNFLMIAGVVAPIAAIIMGQDAIQGERLSGTAAWVLSKPLRRPAFILAKLIAHGVGFLATWVVLPGAVAYLEFALLGKDAPAGAWLRRGAGAGLSQPALLPDLGADACHAVSGSGSCVGDPAHPGVGLLITPLGVLLADVMPWRLLKDLGKNGALPALGGYLWQGFPLPTVTPIIATAVWCVLFIGIAIWRFRRGRFLTDQRSNLLMKGEF